MPPPYPSTPSALSLRCPHPTLSAPSILPMQQIPACATSVPPGSLYADSHTALLPRSLMSRRSSEARPRTAFAHTNSRPGHSLNDVRWTDRDFGPEARNVPLTPAYRRTHTKHPRSSGCSPWTTHGTRTTIPPLGHAVQAVQTWLGTVSIIPPPHSYLLGSSLTAYTRTSYSV